MNEKAYFLVPTGKRLFFLRRDHKKPLQPGHEYADYCHAECLLMELEAGQEAVSPAWDSDLWPTVCNCGHVFTDKDTKNTSETPLYKRSDTGEEITIGDATPGAIWDADWMKGMYDTEDGKILVAMCPGRQHWTIDGRASNCDSPCKNCGKPYHLHIKTAHKKTDEPNEANCTNYVDSNPHKCWIRHGEPPMLTVDKKGNTCGAGAGSIQTANWHGFLRNGVFETC